MIDQEQDGYPLSPEFDLLLTEQPDEFARAQIVGAEFNCQSIQPVFDGGQKCT